MNDCIFIDVEASGFGPGSYPIEIGLAGPAGHSDCFLIAPDPSWTHWDERAEGLHGISRITLLEHGRPITEVADALNARLEGRTVFSDAWGQDMPWVARLFADAGRCQRFRVESIVKLLSEDDRERWHATKAAIATRLSLTRHRASTDAQILRSTYEALASQEAACPEPPEAELPAFSAIAAGRP